jgi:hypothetical protein
MVGVADARMPLLSFTAGPRLALSDPPPDERGWYLRVPTVARAEINFLTLQYIDSEMTTMILTAAVGGCRNVTVAEGWWFAFVDRFWDEPWDCCATTSCARLLSAELSIVNAARRHGSRQRLASLADRDLRRKYRPPSQRTALIEAVGMKI